MTKPAPAATAAEVIAARSPLWTAFFTWIMRRRMGTAFNAVRLAGAEPSPPADRPVVIYSNHPAWWDPAFFMLLADRLMGARIGFGPMDAAALQQYGFMRRLGIFGIEAGAAAGARRFLRIGRGLLAAADHALWITAQGEFTDARVRPPGLRRGLATLLARTPHPVTVLPLALEYPFWSESKPEALCRFGAPVALDAPAGRDLQPRLEAALADTQNALAADAISRDAARFTLLQQGRAGIGGVYDLYRRLRAAARGEAFSSRHEPGRHAPGHHEDPP